MPNQWNVLWDVSMFFVFIVILCLCSDGLWKDVNVLLSSAYTKLKYVPCTTQMTLCFSKASMLPILYRTRRSPHIALIDKADLHMFKHIWG